MWGGGCGGDREGELSGEFDLILVRCALQWDGDAGGESGDSAPVEGGGVGSAGGSAEAILAGRFEEAGCRAGGWCIRLARWRRRSVSGWWRR